MDRNLGLEAVMGIGGGGDSLSSRTLTQAEAALRQGKPEVGVRLILKAVQENPENLDAHLLLASLGPRKERYDIYERAGIIGKQALIRKFGPKTFDDSGGSVGHFWGIVETRPYMRVLGSMRETLAADKRWKEAIDISLEMLRLCPGDNMAIRNTFPSYLIHAKRYLEALNFIFNWLDCVNGETPPRGGGIITARLKNDYDWALTNKGSGKVKKNIERSWGSEHMYDGAKAAFELFGNCELARVMLRKATKSNPHIMTRILSKHPQPDEPCYLPRQMNGVESAVDYLHVAQSYWYTNPHCLKWVNSDPVVSEIVKKKCSNPLCENRETVPCEFSACSGCREAFYCGGECQATHWKLPKSENGHKAACKSAQGVRKMTEEAAKNMSTYFG